MLTTQFAHSAGFTSQSAYFGADRPAHAKPAGNATAEAEATPPAAGEKLSRQDTEKLVKDLNAALQGINVGLEFSQDEESGRTIIKVIDRETKETLRQFPSEEALAISRTLDKLKGVLIRQSA